MPWIRLPDGTVAHLLIRGRKPAPRCSCGRASSLQCDYPIAPGRTCDAFICTRCADRVGGCIDYCPAHRRQGLLDRVSTP